MLPDSTLTLARTSRPIAFLRSASGLAPALLLAASALAAVAYFFTFLRPIADELDTFLPVDPADTATWL